MAREIDFVDECYADKDLSLLKKLTLVIPTYNRNYYLSRCLWYHAHFPFGQIIVADSSPEEKKVVNRKTVAKIRRRFGVGILYLEYEPETERYGGDIYRKWGDAVMHADSEYSVFCTDREFIIPTLLNQSLDYLTQHPEYICASGNRGDVMVKKSEYGIVQPFSMNSYEDDEPLKRIIDFSNRRRIIENLFSIYPSSVHKKMFENLIKYHICDIRYGEIALELQPIIIGKIKRFNDVQRFRDQTQKCTGTLNTVNKSDSSSSRHPRVPSYPDSLRSRLQENLAQCLGNLLTDNSNKTKFNKIDAISRNIVEWWMCGVSLSDNKHLGFLWDAIPNSLKYLLSKCIGKGLYCETRITDINNPYYSSILKIISDTSEKYTMDSVISQINSESF